MLAACRPVQRKLLRMLLIDPAQYFLLCPLSACFFITSFIQVRAIFIDIVNIFHIEIEVEIEFAFNRKIEIEFETEFNINKY